MLRFILWHYVHRLINLVIVWIFINCSLKNLSIMLTLIRFRWNVLISLILIITLCIDSIFIGLWIILRTINRCILFKLILLFLPTLSTSLISQIFFGGRNFAFYLLPFNKMWWIIDQIINIENYAKLDESEASWFYNNQYLWYLLMSNNCL